MFIILKLALKLLFKIIDHSNLEDIILVLRNGVITFTLFLYTIHKCVRVRIIPSDEHLINKFRSISRKYKWIRATMDNITGMFVF